MGVHDDNTIIEFNWSTFSVPYVQTHNEYQASPYAYNDNNRRNVYEKKKLHP